MRLKAFLLLLPGSLLSAPSFGQTPRAETPSPIPVRSVTLFTSGVSYIEREGEVNGDALVPLSFRTAQINDILKSLVLLDEKGAVQPATYAARDPIGRTLRTFAIDVTQPMSRAEILNRLRGARVTVETTTGRGSVTGQIVGVETRTEKVKEEAEAVTVEILTVLSDSGLQSVKLSDVTAVRLLDARLDREFREALTLLAAGADDQRRQVTLRFDGDGRRRVRVGYVTEAPLWKMSYRLVVGGTRDEARGTSGAEGKAAPPSSSSLVPGTSSLYLQGWALVENTTDEDWQNVRLSLVSGRPVSFIQDLYQPLYLPRPVVAPDIVASPYPQTHGGSLADADTPSDAPTVAETEARDGSEVARRARAARPAPAAPPPAAAPGGGGQGGFAGGEGKLGAESLRGSVAAQAQGRSAGELFQYNITTPVSLPRQQAAMIPVVARDVEGEKVSLYNADADARFPLNAVRVVNNTALHLKGGPLTVFDDGTYAGDARMEDVPPGDSRLVTYAVDLSVEGERQGAGTTATQTSLALRRGVLTITRRERQTTKYTLKSKVDKPRTVLVEHPFNSEFKLIAPEKAAERTADRYRFSVPVPPRKSTALEVVVERPVYSSVTLLNDDLNALGVYATRQDVPAAIRTALQQVIQRRRRVQELQAQAEAREREIVAIGQDQDRIRRNMAALDKASALYKRYVSELDRQETRIQGLRAEAQRLRNAGAEADRDLRAFIDKLDISG
uniref:DUF4139 domain-containing protein n=1 Tax=uncultured Armatimonadetes bacterium TaxID=157466 RepID=A0A6J4IPV2_9BACT|nr:hypothetical protein AVDCRST_MAG63-2187 [uncultured Armatimonadetes bacterium]